MMVVGRLEGVKLFEPQMFSLFNTTEGQQMGLSMLPGDPAFITLKDFGWYGVVRDETLLALYMKVTKGIEIPVRAPLVTPGGLKLVN